jgi:hypothetical protein
MLSRIPLCRSSPCRSFLPTLASGAAALLLLSLIGSSQAAHLHRAEAAFDAAAGVGVAKVTLDLSAVEDFQRWQSQTPFLHGDRLLYPIVEPPRVLGNLGARLTGGGLRVPSETAIWFLFKGDSPLEVVLQGSERVITVVPKLRKAAHRRLLNEWWRAQQRWLKLDSKDEASFPPYLQTYLMGVHSRRLGMRLPPAKNRRLGSVGAERTLSLLTGSEDLRQEMFWRVATDAGAAEPPDFDLPASIRFAEPTYPALVDAVVETEPMAAQVPADCFYIRFGKYSNLMWFQHLLEEHAADIGRLVTLRGTNANYGEKVKSQLVIDQLPFAELIGDKVIQDVALIGRDLFFREGAAVGLILQENAPVVANGLKKMRRQRAKDEQVTLSTIEIRGEKVSFLATADHRVRSYYVERDGFHLISNCRYIVDRFLGLGQGVERLSETSSFRHARTKMPLDREDTLFAYFSPRFFAGLFDAHYRIEMQRRLRASCELDLVRLANLAWVNEVSHDFLGAAECEVFEHGEDWLQQLAQIRLLPPHFADREDQSRPVAAEDRWNDSRRGASGFFLPIPDTPVTTATASELADYQALAEFHAREWSSFDPLVVGISRARQKDADELEQLTIDARLEASAMGKYERFSKRLGEANPQQLVCEPPLLASFQVSLANQLSNDANTLSWGVLDQAVEGPANAGGLLGALALWRSAPAFLSVTDGSLLSGRLLDRLRDFDAEGYFEGVGGLWRRKHEGLTTLSYHRNVLEHVTNTTEWIEAEEPVQARLSIGCLEDSQLASWLAAAARSRGQEASLRNARLMHAFMSQLAVDGSAAKRHAEQLVGAELICPLGGEYSWQAGEGQQLAGAAANEAAGSELPRWISSAWSERPGELLDPADESIPAVLKWCHGLEAHMKQEAKVAALHAEILLHRQAEEKKFEFSPLKFFSRKKAKESE